MSPSVIAFNGFSFDELQTPAGLARLDACFRERVAAADGALAERLDALRGGEPLGPRDHSALLLELAPHLERFVTGLFGIEASVEALRAELTRHDPVLRFKNEYVLRRTRKIRELPDEDFDRIDAWLEQQLDADYSDREAAVAAFANGLLIDPERNEETINRIAEWCALAQRTEAGARAVNGWTAFKLPQKVDHTALVPLVAAHEGEADVLNASPERLRRRDGFQLTDRRMDTRHIQGEVNYCIYCHEHNGDFCSKGFPEKKKQPELGLKVDPLGNKLTGCPLEEKISEMHVCRRDAMPVAALAMAMIDNPMIPATGHRICNDCMKACIYQKQDPVDIPQIETGTLTDVLRLPWGVEVYHLLARWNPLRPEQYVQQPDNGRRVMVAGMGPSGFTMAHHLTMAGCAVLGIDGLKIEPLPEELLNAPVRDWDALEEPLDERILLGFGGVAEYGITVRWDKNFLKLIYLTLARRHSFAVRGGVRLGGTVTIEDAWQLGFDHVSVATGTGLPRVVSIGNSLARGMRQASDFLMALQLTGAGKESSIANLQVRLPAVVVGGGLTGVDTATEVQAYYIKQVEKTLWRYETLVAERGEDAVLSALGDEDREILAEFLEHGRAVRDERARAAAVGETPDFTPLLQAWGGVTIAYRKGLNDSPAYTRNHEEVAKATEEGIRYAEGLDPLHCELDDYGHVRTLICRRMHNQGGRWLAGREEVHLPAKAVFVAAGTVPNTIYEREYPGTFALNGDFFESHVEHHDRLQPVAQAEHAKSQEFGPFTSYNQGGHKVSFIGDTHPAFHGSVVKAIASSMRTYPEILDALGSAPRASDDQRDSEAFLEEVADRFQATVLSVNTSDTAMAEVWVRAPMAARNFRPGQFYRLQTFESLSPVVEGTRLQVPLLTVSGTGVKDDMIRLMVLQFGAGPRLVGRLKPGDPIVLMGPTGKPTEIPENETVMVIAGRWGAAAMLDIGHALREGGNRVLYIAAFGNARDVDLQSELENGADQIVWATANEPTIEARREQDRSVIATDMVDLVQQYGDGKVADDHTIDLQQVDRILVMGGTGLLRGFQGALTEGALTNHFRPDIQAMGTAGSPMQCMLKGVCAQCLQWQKDPETGERTRPVFSCAEQDQPLAWIDLDNLQARQQQNRLPDRLTSMWLDYVLEREGQSPEGARAG
ncbi:pyridine nucleotide-disulfide oxidoreductase [Halofilum ochraceum]|uniref:pyridine nucleotide-disulfide oxidoreductase n=1 Tax=Halofilum ochraceum TaxID=1611323 RepID=UPI003CCC1DB3